MSTDDPTDRPNALTQQSDTRVDLHTEREKLQRGATATLRASVPEGTRRTYERNWRVFTAWCDERDVSSLPVDPTVLVLYLQSCLDDGLARSTITGRLAAIRRFHVDRGHPDVSRDKGVRAWMKGMKRTVPRAKKKEALRGATLVDVIPQGDSIQDFRDRALLLTALAGGFRRSELVGFNVEDLRFEEKGAVLTVRRSKTDQEGEGAEVGIVYARDPRLCAPSALLSWRDQLQNAKASEPHMPLFCPVRKNGQVRYRRLTGEGLRLILKRHLEAAGLSDRDFSPHSLRSGMATDAAVAGKSVESVAKQGRWASLETVLGYYRPVTVFEKNTSDVY